ncbi:MAG: S1/P1 nuclease [Gammaproteobacteria bacterium]|nr:S1/P1 nuclease [Gammaproteobacteria bacterium]MDH5274877.1 S1/P1 nuclease [Gammaproteobacteria bacterium]
MPGSVYHRACQPPAVARLVVLAFAGLVALGGSAPARAFGPSGHRIVGYLADRHLCSKTRAALRPLLAGQTLADAGTWPDKIRRQPEWEHTRPWHYINVSDHGSVARVARQSSDNVLAALARFENELADTSLSDQQRRLALRFVAHFVADIHQPLHVGRAGDRGGNLIPVRVGKRKTNLHAVWDADLLRIAGVLGPREWVRRQPVAGAAEVLRLQRAKALEWAGESQALRPRVYAFDRDGEGPFPLSPGYLDTARALAAERLQTAGIRLAGRLNAAFAGPGGCDSEVASR